METTSTYTSSLHHWLTHCFSNLIALICISAIGYQTDKGFNVSRVAASLPQRLLPKSASVRGFFLFGYPKEIKVCKSCDYVLSMRYPYMSRLKRYKKSYKTIKM